MNFMLLYCFGLYIASCIFMVIGFYKKYTYGIIKKYFNETTGIVIGNRKEKRPKRYGYVYTPIIEYSIKELDYTIEDLPIGVFLTKIGTKVKILYNPDKPNDAIIKSNSTWLLYFIIGIICFILAFLVLFLFYSN